MKMHFFSRGFRRSISTPMLVLASVAAIGINAAWGQGTVVNFDPPVGVYVTTSFTNQGFRFSATRMEVNPDWRDVSPDTDGMLRITDGVLRIERLSGAPFDLFQLDIQTAGYSTAGAPWTGTETVTGVFATGGSVQQSFNITQNWSTYSLPGTFRNLLYVNIPVNLFGGFQIDNMVVVSATPSCVSAPSGLVGWWRGEGNANDVTGANNGTVVGATFVAGTVGEAFNFNGTGQKVTIPDNDAVKLTNSLTIEGWVYPRANGFILFRGDSRPGLDPYALTIELTHELQFLVCNADNTAMFLRTPGAVPMNQWLHVAATFDGATGAARLYVNGALAANTNTTIRPMHDLDTAKGPGIGIGGHAGAYDYFSFDGMIDELSLYSRALTSNEIAAIYAADGAGKCLSPPPSGNCLPPAAGLVGWWPGEGNTSDNTGMNSGLAQDIIYTNGEVGQTFVFNGSSSQIRIPASPALNVGLGSGLTVEVWINPADLSLQELCEWNQNDGVPYGAPQIGTHMEINESPGDGSFWGNLIDTTGIAHVINSATGVITANSFQHLAMTYDKATGVAVLYRNGVVVAQNNLGVFTPQTSFDFFLGNRPSGYFTGIHFRGMMDEPSVYNRALGTNEIAAIFAVGSAGKCLTPAPSVLPPVITDFSPKSGTNGTVVTLTGTNFSPVSVSNVVYLGALRATVTFASATTLTVTVPVGATFAPPTVTVGGLTAFAKTSFMPTFNGGGATITSSSFAPRVDISNPIGAHRTVIADLDGDGKPDLAVSGGVQHGISLYRNTGSPGTLGAGSFAPRVDILTLPVADSPWDLVVADVDGDGKLDLLEANRGGNIVSILRNISTPGSLSTNSFAPSVDLSVGDLPLGIVVRDMDGDGRAEVVVGNFNSGNVAVFRNIGTAGSLSTNSFAAPVFFTTEAGTHSLSAEDLDGDGKPDLAAVNANANSVSILRNTSTPGTINASSFAPQFSLATPEYTHHVKTADLDGDGKPDLLITSVFGYAMSVFRNIATPGTLNSSSFAARVDFPLAGRGHTISLGDLNGDNKLDVVVDTEISDAVSIFQNLSTPGSFTTASLGSRVDLTTGYNAWGSSVGDLDGDGRPDIVFANTYDNTISLYRNVSGAPPAPSGLVPAIFATTPNSAVVGASVTITGTNFSSVTTNNLVRFGAVRALVTAASANSLTVLVPKSATYAPITVTVGGLVASAPMPFQPTFAGGNSTLSTASFQPRFDLAGGEGAHRSAIADLDGDGKPDLAVANAYGHTISLFRNLSSVGALATNSFTARVDLSAPAGDSDNPYGFGTADVDGDGKLDLVACDRIGNNISVYRNIATSGTLNASSFAPYVNFPVGADPRYAAVADLDGDGRPDIVSCNFAANTISILRNIGSAGSLGTNSFAPRVDLPAGVGAFNVAIGDLDGDGKPDLAVLNLDGFSMSVYRNIATPGTLAAGSFAPRVDFAAPDGSDTIAFGDIDGNGKPDLVIGSFKSATISVYRNQATPGAFNTNSLAARVDFSTGNWTHTVALADLNGDGKTDIATVGELNSYLSLFQNLSTPGNFTTSSLGARVDLSSGWNAWGLSAGDLDGDGLPDLVFCNAYDATVSIYRNVIVAAPKIVQEPPKETIVTAGSPVAFTVVATGTTPLAYQWFFKQGAIAGATNATYNILSATSTNAGSYQVRVTNQFGLAWSQGNLLTVLPALSVPVITDFNPKAGTPGSTVSLLGTNFSSVAVSNIVYFGAERGTVTFASPTTLRVTVPASATYAPPSVTVRGLTGAAKNSFTPTFAGGGLLTASNFAARVNLTPGSGPTATVMADFDGDGKPDLAVSDGTSHTVSVFRNISTGGTLTASSFGPRVVLPGTGTSGNAPYMLTAADVNGDGKLDLVTTDMDANSVSVFRNLATPGVLTASSFAARVVFTVGSSPRDVVVRDLDGDGKPEIVTANGGSASVSVLKNVSSPSAITSTSFLARVDFVMGSGAHGLAVADLDGDGKPDIATANGSTTNISIRRNISPPGTLTTNSFAGAITLAGPSYPHFLRAADLDGDGKLDLILSSYLGQSVSIYRNLATPGALTNGSFAARVEFALGTRGHTISFGDLNGDAKPDVIVDCEIPDRICVFQNLSTPGSFTSSSFARRVDLPAGYNAWGSSVGDLDGDARPDIAYANYYEGTISFAQNLSGAPQFLQQPLSQTVYIGDFVSLTSSATGNQPLTYRWYRNNSLLNGATGNSLTLSNVLLAQAGSYSVSVSNAFGVATSSNAVLTVLVPECTTTPAGLVGWWSGNGNAFDSVSTNHGMWNGTAQYSAAKVDSGLRLDGVNYLNVGNSPSLNVGLGDGMTIEGWINPASIAEQQPLAEWATDGIEVGVHFWISVPFFGTPRPGCLYANLMDDSHNAHTFASASSVVQAGVLQHVALTYDKVSGMARMYRNGQEVASANLGTFTPNTASELLLGKRTSPPGNNFAGVLDEMSLYERSLSSNEVIAIYNARSEGKCKLRPTVLAVTPPGAFVNEGQTVSFTALAVGSPVLSYQWQHNFTDILGATSATITLSDVVYAQAGNYCVIVSNSAGISDKWNVVLLVNRAPLANASATEPLVISPNGSNAVVVLDGSRSSDPDGDPMTYAWFRASDAVPFASGVIAVPTLPVGNNALTLVVRDGMASGSQNFAVEVITTSEAVERLIARVQAGAGKTQPLIASLRAALAAIDRGQPETAINQLEAFINKVHAQVEPADPALAAQFIADAQAIIDALNGGSVPGVAALEITSLSHGNNGKPHLKIKGANNRTLIVETSTNLVDWEKVGVAGRCGDCAYEFEDAQTSTVGARYYRVVSPK